MRSGGFGNGAIADGRWHSFGRGGGFGGRGAGNFALSHTGGNRFAGNGLGFRGRGFGFDRFGFDRFGFNRFGFNRFGFGFGRPFFGFGLGWGWGAGWGCGWGWPYWDWGWGCPGYWGLGWDYPAGEPYWDGDGPYGYDDAWEWDNNNTGNYSDYTGDGNADYSDDSVDSSAPNDDQQASQDTTQTQPSSTHSVDPESIPTVVYLKDGTTLQMTAYWSSGNMLHYENGEGGVSTLDVNQIDFERTVDENAKHGVRFPIQPHPSTTRPSAPAMTSSPAAPSAPAAAATSSLPKTA